MPRKNADKENARVAVPLGEQRIPRRNISTNVSNVSRSSVPINSHDGSPRNLNHPFVQNVPKLSSLDWVKGAFVHHQPRAIISWIQENALGYFNYVADVLMSINRRIFRHNRQIADLEDELKNFRSEFERICEDYDDRIVRNYNFQTNMMRRISINEKDIGTLKEEVEPPRKRCRYVDDEAEETDKDNSDSE